MDTTSAQTQGSAGDSTMTENIGRGERALSVVTGAWMIARGLLRARNSPWSLLVALAGLPLIKRGTTGQSKLYQMLGIDTERRLSLTAGVDPRRAETVEASVVIERPIGEVYEFVRRFENLPQFFAEVDRVTRIEGGGWRWVAAGPLGRTLEWDVDVTQDIELQRVAWRSRPGSVMANEGSIEFHAIPGGTEVVARLMYEPLAGKLGAQVARAFGVDAQRTLVRDMARLKQILEARADMLPESAANLGAGAFEPTAGFSSDLSGDFAGGDDDLVDPVVAQGRQDIAAERDATLDEADFESDQSFPASDSPSRY